MRFDKYTVALALTSSKGVYMSRRIHTENFSGKWQFAGGKLEDGESPLVGGVRECKEETGLDISIDRLRYVGSIAGDPSTYVCYVYYVDLKTGEIPHRMEEEKYTDWEWHRFDDVLKLDLMPGIEMIINKMKGMKTL
jgi:8-oxo-dGTP diphosphatase